MYILDASRADAGIKERSIWQRLAAADATDVALREIIHRILSDDPPRLSSSSNILRPPFYGNLPFAQLKRRTLVAL